MQAAQASVREDDGDEAAEAEDLLDEVMEAWVEYGGCPTTMLMAMQRRIDAILIAAATKH